jgi:hypothetical protein
VIVEELAFPLEQAGAIVFLGGVRGGVVVVPLVHGGQALYVEDAEPKSFEPDSAELERRAEAAQCCGIEAREKATHGRLITKILFD